MKEGGGGTELVAVGCAILVIVSILAKVTGMVYACIITALSMIILCLIIALVTERSLRKQQERHEEELRLYCNKLLEDKNK